MSIDNQDQVKDDLTYEQWSRFCKLYLMMPNSKEDFLRSTFEGMREHEVLRKFWTYDDSAQYNIGQKIVSGVSVKNVAAYVELCEKVDLKLQTLTNRAFSCKSYSLASLKTHLYSAVGYPPELFTGALFGLSVHIHKEKLNVDSWGDMHIIVLYMLQFLHDDLIVDIIKRWIQSAAFIDLHEMIILADNWSSVKQYPIDWAVNVLK